MKRLDQLIPAARNAGVHLPGPSAQADDITPGCPICGGAGFVRRRRPVDDPLFGKAEPCECVLVEAADTRTDRLQRVSNLGPLARFTFAALSPRGRTGNSETFDAVLGVCAAFASAPSGWVVLHGPSGTGKTHLAAAVANAAIAEGRPALFVVVPDLLDHLRASYDATEDDLGYEQLFDQVKNAQLLILDDIDAAAETAWAKEKLFQVVNHRFNAQLPTVFTCSIAPPQLESRLATRLSDTSLAQVLNLGGNAQKAAYHEVGGMRRDRLDSMQFRDFDLDAPNLLPNERDSLAAALNVARDFAERPRGWLVFSGANGCGKTHLAAAIANRVLREGESVFFAVVPDLLDHLRASFAPGRDVGYDEVFEQVRTVALLVLDDLGAHASSPWAQEKLYQIVNYRTLAGLPTVVTTDLGSRRLQEAHPRIQARIADPKAGTTVEISAPHYRLGRMSPAPGRSGGPPSPRAR